MPRSTLRADSEGSRFANGGSFGVMSRRCEARRVAFPLWRGRHSVTLGTGPLVRPAVAPGPLASGIPPALPAMPDDARPSRRHDPRDPTCSSGFRLLRANPASLPRPIVSLDPIRGLSPIDNDDPFESPLEGFDRECVAVEARQTRRGGPPRMQRGVNGDRRSHESDRLRIGRLSSSSGRSIHDQPSDACRRTVPVDGCEDHQHCRTIAGPLLRLVAVARTSDRRSPRPDDPARPPPRPREAPAACKPARAGEDSAGFPRRAHIGGRRPGPPERPDRPSRARLRPVRRRLFLGDHLEDIDRARSGRAPIAKRAFRFRFRFHGKARPRDGAKPAPRLGSPRLSPPVRHDRTDR